MSPVSTYLNYTLIWKEPDNRRMVEIQKTVRGLMWQSITWPSGSKPQWPSQHDRECYVIVAVQHELTLPPRSFAVPRSHVTVAAWIEDMNWLTEPGFDPGNWNAPVDPSMRHLRETLAQAEADGTHDPHECGAVMRHRG